MPKLSALCALRPRCAFVVAAFSACTVEGGATTTYADVAPLLEASCVECHHDGSAGRPSLASFASASEHAEEALVLVEAGLMPPGGLDRSGACGNVLGPLPLTIDEVATLRAWVDAGMPPADAPVPQPAGASEELVSEAVVASLALSATDDDELRCFAVDVGYAGRLLTGVRVRDAGPVHHAMVFTVDDNAALGDDVWSCPGTPAVDGAALAFAWVPGRATSEFPSGYGVALSRRVVVQLHEHGPGVGHVDVELIVADDARALDVVTLAIAGFVLPPGRDVEIERMVAAPVGGRVVAAMPHMHQLGRSLSLVIDGSGPCVVSAPRWSWGFQELALFAEGSGVELEAGTRLTLSCVWDTRERTGATPWGETSDDEMCTVFLFVARAAAE